MLRIREAECTQTIGDLRQKIAELEVQVRAPNNKKKKEMPQILPIINSRIKN